MFNFRSRPLATIAAIIYNIKKMGLKITAKPSKRIEISLIGYSCGVLKSIIKVNKAKAKNIPFITVRIFEIMSLIFPLFI